MITHTVSTRFLAGVAILSVSFLACIAIAWLNVRHARGPRERVFVRRVSLLTLAMGVAFTAAIALLPPPHLYAAAAGFFVLVPASVYRWSIQHQLIRELDSRQSVASIPGKPAH